MTEESKIGRQSEETNGEDTHPPYLANEERSQRIVIQKSRHGDREAQVITKDLDGDVRHRSWRNRSTTGEHS